MGNDKPILLLVDDDGSLLRELAAAFNKPDRQIIRASGGKEALALVKIQPIDVMVCDVQMPKGNGFWLLRQLVGENIRPRFFCFYSSVFAGSRSPPHPPEADRCFAKYVEFFEMQAWVEESLGRVDNR